MPFPSLHPAYLDDDHFALEGIQILSRSYPFERIPGRKFEGIEHNPAGNSREHAHCSLHGIAAIADHQLRMNSISKPFERLPPRRKAVCPMHERDPGRSQHRAKHRLTPGHVADSHIKLHLSQEGSQACPRSPNAPWSAEPNLPKLMNSRPRTCQFPMKSPTKTNAEMRLHRWAKTAAAGKRYQKGFDTSVEITGI